MATANARRRGHGKDAIYFDAATNGYIGAVSVGYETDGRRVRRKVSGKAEQEVWHKLKELHSDLDAGVHSPASYTVRAAVDDWRAEGLSGRAPKTVSTQREVLEPLLDIIGAVPLRQLSAAHVRSALKDLAATPPPVRWAWRTPGSRGRSGTPRPTIRCAATPPLSGPDVTVSCHPAIAARGHQLGDLTGSPRPGLPDQPLSLTRGAKLEGHYSLTRGVNTWQPDAAVGSAPIP